MTKADVLILGGGLAGLSTAYHLNALGRVSSLVVEKNPSVGGTAGTVAQDGFLFDYTGHLLHLHDERAKRLILDLLGRNVASHRRRSFIYSHGVHTPYPFQANTFGLPERVVEDCVAGFLRTVHRPGPSLPANPSFESWCLRQFGPGISRHFMLPYNRKLWRLPLSKLTTEWQGRFVPRPSAAEVLCGALGAQKKAFGYNSSFRYPRRGGIQALSDAFLARLRPGQVQVGCAVQKIDLRQRVAVVEGLGEVSFKRLVNTIPLPDFVDLAWPLSSEVRAARGRLRWNTVYNLNLGVARDVSDKHWVYFPEARYPFYRVGFSHNFSRANAPAGAGAIYIEAARPAGEAVDLVRLENAMLDGLRRCGILRSGDRLLTKLWLPIRCGYVVYDFARTPALARILAALRRRGVESIGRYGAWKYSFMEETILDGERCARRLLGLGAPAGSGAPGWDAELRPLR